MTPQERATLTNHMDDLFAHAEALYVQAEAVEAEAYEASNQLAESEQHFRNSSDVRKVIDV